MKRVENRFRNKLRNAWEAHARNLERIRGQMTAALGAQEQVAMDFDDREAVEALAAAVDRELSERAIGGVTVKA